QREPDRLRTADVLLGDALAALRDRHGARRECDRARRFREVAVDEVRADRVRRRVAARAPLAARRRLQGATEGHAVAEAPAERVRPRPHPPLHAAARAAARRAPPLERARGDRRRAHAALCIRLSALGLRRPRARLAATGLGGARVRRERPRALPPARSRWLAVTTCATPTSSLWADVSSATSAA